MRERDRRGWRLMEAEAQHAFVGPGRFPLPAYSELMPPPWVGFKPYDPRCADAPATAGAAGATTLDVTEYEQVEELGPGLRKIAAHVLDQVAKLARGHAHDMSRALLADNPAWPPVLAEAARAGRFRDAPVALALALALSRTQDDQGNVRWTIFGASHEGPAAPFWASFGARDRQRFARVVAHLTGLPPRLDEVRVLAAPAEVPAFAARLLLDERGPLGGVRVLVTFRPFATLPAAVRRAYLGGKLRLVPSPGSLVFFHHPGYAALARSLPRAQQIPLLHLFPRVQGGYTIRIPQSGWLDEVAGGEKVVPHVVRTHRWQRRARDESLSVEGAFADHVSVALFSTNPDHLGLYDKPMARNAQMWRDDYELLLDGPRATVLELERAAQAAGEGGRYGYRFYYPPMRAGRRELFWHRPLIARLDPGDTGTVLHDEAPLGYVLAEPQPEESYLPRISLRPRLLSRPGHREAARLFDHEAGQARATTRHNIRKLLEFREYLGAPLRPSLARALLRIGRDVSLEDWLARLPGLGTERAGGVRLARRLRALLGRPADLGPARTFARTRTRAFEERLFATIAALAHGEFRAKDNADTVAANAGKTGGEAARAAHLARRARRDLEQLGDHLHARHRALIEAHGMLGRARVADHTFRWETDFAFPWSEGWSRNQSRSAHERNIVVMIPGRRRDEAVIMADHYDTAYMEDLYEPARGGDGLRAAAAGADDNHSATATLLAAADALLPLARAGALERDVWLVHLTGEEFPSDCLGARALARALVERRLRLAAEDGAVLDVSHVQVVGAFVLDMIGHNSQHGRDVFQIAPGEGAAAARLALRAHLASERWNAGVPEWNRAPARAGRGRAQRSDSAAAPPPPFAHLALAGEIRTEWEPRSSLYNTDGQIFSDVGIPVVLFMENYDLNRAGYHDTQDTLANIDLDYAAALAATAIETVADVACAREV
ncbi:MAG TPA: M28 family peptidase [Polyangia bacterium]